MCPLTLFAKDFRHNLAKWQVATNLSSRLFHTIESKAGSKVTPTCRDRQTEQGGVLFAGAVQQQSLSPGHHRAGLERDRDPPTLDGEWFATGLTHIHTHEGRRRKVRKARQGPAKSRHVKRELASGTRNMAEKTLQALPNGAASRAS